MAKTPPKKSTNKTKTVKKKISKTNKTNSRSITPKLSKKKTTKPVKAKKKTTKRKKQPVNEVKHISISENAKNAKFVEMGRRVQNGEIKWVRYESNGKIGYHYYALLK
jgi:hypothetical protein